MNDMFQIPDRVCKTSQLIVKKIIPLNKSYFNLNTRQQEYWNRVLRWLVPSYERWLFEGNRNIWGQLWKAERQLVFETTYQVKPCTAFEVGTWNGGGSTYFIASAMHQNNYGTLHTIEVNPDFYNSAKTNYQKYSSELLAYVQFHLGSSTDVYPRILTEETVDLLFLDGLGPVQTLAEFKMFEPFLAKNATLIAHDWNDEKMKQLRPYIEENSLWSEVSIIGPPNSVGLAVFQLKDK